MRALFEIYNIDAKILSCIDEETGEIKEPEELEKLGIERDRLIEELGKLYKNEQHLQECCEREIESIRNKMEASSQTMESIKKGLTYQLKGQKFKSGSISIHYRKSEKVEVEDITKLDDDYLNYSEPTANKEKIKESLKQGISLNGVRLVEQQNIQIS